MQKNNSTQPVLVVGIGASAGDLESFKDFFSTIPDDSGTAFVLFPHLSPSHRSLIPELLTSQIDMVVVEAKNNTLVEPNHIYVLPAGKYLTINDGRLLLHSANKKHEQWNAIETFLSSLAKEQTQRGVAVILSGAGSHGTAGIREVKLNDGMFLAQSPETCSDSQIPSNAIDTESDNTSSKKMEDEIIIRQLKDELDATRIDRQSNIEELKASNEEVMSMNKELQSANEELETSKEELQSSNEELSTVNTELQCKLEELEISNDDVSNLLSSTDIATVFLNREMKIMLFNPTTTNLMNLRKGDIGRPISDLSTKVVDDSLLQDAKTVLDNLAPIERDIKSKDEEDKSKCYLRRIVPHRAADNRISGVVITFVDITERNDQKRQLEKSVREGAEKLHDREHRLQAIMQHAAEAIVVINDKGIITDFNQSAEQIFGYNAKEIVGHNIKHLMPQPYQDQHDEYLKKFRHRKKTSRFFSKQKEFSALHKDGFEFPISLNVNQVDKLNLYVGIIRDLTEKRTLQKAITEINTKNLEKIGLELHDSLGQRLTGISLLLQNFKRHFKSKNGSEVESLNEISEQLNLAIGETRDISYGLAPISLTSEGLPNALRSLVEVVGDPGVKCQFVYTSSKIVKDIHTTMQVYRIAQEALNNALKHAHAKNIRILLEDYGEQLRLSIQDDGQGFKLKNNRYEDGIGLQIMEYRANSIGASFKIDTSANAGTNVQCIF